MKLLALILILCPSLAWAAPTFDAATTGTGNGVSSVTVNHTVGAGCSNPIIVVGISWQKNPTGTLDTLTVGGVGGTEIDTSNWSASGGYTHELWYRVGASGANDVIATFDAAKNSITVGVRSYCGVDQVTPIGTANKATGLSGTNPTVDITSAAGELVVDMVSSVPDAGSQTLTVGASQTDRANFAQDATNHIQGGSEEAGAATTTMSWTLGTVGAWGSIGVPLKPSSSSTRRPGGVFIF